MYGQVHLIHNTTTLWDIFSFNMGTFTKTLGGNGVISLFFNSKLNPNGYPLKINLRHILGQGTHRT